MVTVLHLCWWWLVIQLLWLVSLPICLQVLRTLPDRGTSVAKAFGILAFVYPLWFIGSLGFLDNSRVSYAIVLLAIGALALAIWRRSSNDLRAFLRSHYGLLVLQEGIFLGAYLGFALIRMFNPDVANTEKFMDFAFMSGAWRSESFPPLDPWFSGETINYYYFGHLTVAVLTRLSGLLLAETFNLTLALLFGLAALGAFGVVFNLVQVHRRASVKNMSSTVVQSTKRRQHVRSNKTPDSGKDKASSLLPGATPSAIVAGFLAIYLLLIAGNLQGPLALLRDSSYLDRDFWQGMGWNSTRVLVVKMGHATFQPLTGQTVSGEAALIDVGFYRSRGTLRINGLKPGGDYTVQFGRGSCANPEKGNYQRANLSADGRGQGREVVTLHTSVKELADEPFHVTIQTPGSAGIDLACGNITGKDLDYTINEFPAFSFLLGDLHPHVLALPFTLLAVQVAFSWWLYPPAFKLSEWRRNRAELGRFLVGAGVLGSLYIFNSWDFPTYFMLASVAMTGAFILRMPTARGVGAALFSALLTALVAVALFAPFYADFRPPASGLGLVPIRSRLDQFLVFWGLMLVPILALLAHVFPWRRLALRKQAHFLGTGEARAAIPAGSELNPGWIMLAAFALILGLTAIRGNSVLVFSIMLGVAGVLAIRVHLKRRAVVFTLVLMVLAVGLIAICEVVYVQDFYGASLRRMNTVFKLYYQAWTLLSLAGGFGTYVLGQALVNRVRTRRRFAPTIAGGAAALATVLVGLGVVYPLVTVMQRTNSFRNQPTLDGFGFLKRHQTEDHQAAQWLIKNISGQPVVLEAVGGPYSQFARIATQTGLPTVLGWVQHERLWRGEAAKKEIDERVRAVDKIYSASNLDEVHHLFEHYDVEYIVYGFLEGMKYRGYGAAARSKFDVGLETVFRDGDTAIYKVGTAKPSPKGTLLKLPHNR